MNSDVPLFSAVSSSARQLRELLRCISFASKAHVRITEEGLRITTEESSTTEAFVFLEKSLFTSYSYNPPPPPSSQDDTPDPPHFQISLTSFLETLNIFTLADPNVSKRPDGLDAFASHRLARHAGNPFSAHTAGICTITYAGEGHPLSIHMSESGVTTTCDLSTYEPQNIEEIPFARDSLALKTIMRPSSLSETITELSSLNPSTLTVTATPSSSSHPTLSFSAEGALGSATVDFTTSPSSPDSSVLETYTCPTKTRASFTFNLLKAAQRAMSAATKVSLRLDVEGVLNLQFLVEVDGVGAGGVGHVFVEFRVVPLVEDAEEGASGSGSESD